MSNVTVRILQPDEPAVLDRLAPDVFDETPVPALTAEFMADPRHHLAVALDAEGFVVGFVSAVHYVHPDKPSELWINEVGVAEPRQGEGIGKRLMATMLDHGRALGCREAWVTTEHDNARARALYTSAGGAEESVVYVTFDLDP